MRRMHHKIARSTCPVKQEHGGKEERQQCEQNRADKQLVHLVLSVVETPAGRVAPVTQSRSSPVGLVVMLGASAPPGVNVAEPGT